MGNSGQRNEVRVASLLQRSHTRTCASTPPGSLRTVGHADCWLRRCRRCACSARGPPCLGRSHCSALRCLSPFRVSTSCLLRRVSRCFIWAGQRARTFTACRVRVLGFEVREIRLILCVLRRLLVLGQLLVVLLLCCGSLLVAGFARLRRQDLPFFADDLCNVGERKVLAFQRLSDLCRGG